LDLDLRELMRAVRQSPEDAVLWVRLSAALERAGKLDASAEAARVAAAAAPLDRVVSDRLGTLGLARGPWPDAAGGPSGAGASPVDGARKGTLVLDEPVAGAHGAVVVGPDGTAWVRVGSRLVELLLGGTVRRSLGSWSPTVSPVVGPRGGLVAVCRERGPLVAPPGRVFPVGSRPRRPTLEEGTLDARGERVFCSWGGVLRGFPLAQGKYPTKIRHEADGYDTFGPPRPAFAPDGTIFVVEADRRGGLVRAVHPEDGERWRLKVRSTIPGPATVAFAPPSALVVRVGDSVQGIDARSGVARWYYRTHIANWFRPPLDGMPAPTIARGKVALVATGWGLSALDLVSGAEIFVRRDLATTVPVAVDRGGVAHVAMPGRLLGVGPTGETVYEVGLPTGGRPPGPPTIGYKGMTYVVGVDAVLGVS
jgi:hypothetical protein